MDSCGALSPDARQVHDVSRQLHPDRGTKDYWAALASTSLSKRRRSPSPRRSCLKSSSSGFKADQSQSVGSGSSALHDLSTWGHASKEVNVYLSVDGRRQRARNVVAVFISRSHLAQEIVLTHNTSHEIVTMPLRVSHWVCLSSIPRADLGRIGSVSCKH